MGRILVTGGAGFIGSHLVEALVARGDEVHVVDSFDDFYPRGVKQANIAPLAAHPKLRLHEADIRDDRALAAAFDAARPEIVVHLAARAGVRPSLERPALYTDVNVTGTLRVLEEARRTKAARVVFASSSSVYGDNIHTPFSEVDSTLTPASPYGATKVAGEAICQSYSRCFGLPIVALRFFTVYGPRQRPDLAIHKFVRAIRRGDPITLFGDGTSERDYTFISDIISGILRAVEYDAFPEGTPYRVFNLGSDRPVTLRTLVDDIARILGRDPVIEWAAEQPGDVRRTWADLTRSRKELGYAPQVSLEAGLRQFAGWMGSVEGA